MIGDYYSASKKEMHGADELLPAMILVVLNSGLGKMASQAYYIKRIRQEELLSGEGEYYLTTFEGTLDYIIRHKVPEQLIHIDQEDDLNAQLEEIDQLASANLTPILTPEPSPRVGLGDYRQINRDLLPTLAPLLWESNEKFITLRSKPLQSMFVSDLERLHYEYQFLIDKYRSLSIVATKLASQSSASRHPGGNS